MRANAYIDSALISFSIFADIYTSAFRYIKENVIILNKNGTNKIKRINKGVGLSYKERKEREKKYLCILQGAYICEEYPKHIVFKLRFFYAYATVAQEQRVGLVIQRSSVRIPK